VQAAVAVEVDERSRDRLGRRCYVDGVGSRTSRLGLPLAPADAIDRCGDGHEGDGPDHERAPETPHLPPRYFRLVGGA
jgi:hypothetical protein